jgi:hypothetical protein
LVLSISLSPVYSRKTRPSLIGWRNSKESVDFNTPPLTFFTPLRILCSHLTIFLSSKSFTWVNAYVIRKFSISPSFLSTLLMKIEQSCFQKALKRKDVKNVYWLFEVLIFGFSSFIVLKGLNLKNWIHKVRSVIISLKITDPNK